MRREIAVISKGNARFFITVIPGLESVCHLELCEKWYQASAFLYPEVKYFKGGIEVELPFEEGCLLNHKLRTSTRILYRAHSFECLDINSFKTEIKKIKWADFYSKKDSLNISFSSRSSKLSMAKQVESVFSKDLGFKLSKEGKRVSVRIFRDHCEVSIDTTGERAQFRGQNKKVGKAPLRDSSAAALIRVLTQGLKGEAVLIDPMMGSGTFLLEALAMNYTLDRKFTFESFPVFSGEKNKEKTSGPFVKVYGFDRDPDMVTTAKHNISSFSSRLHEIKNQDMFSEDKFNCEYEQRLVVLNPPWGRRMQKSKQTVSDWFEAIDRKYSPKRIAILVPTPFTVPEIGWESVRDVYFENSGVLNRFIVFMKP